VKRELKTFDNPRNVRRLLFGFFAVLVILLGLDFFIHKHADFTWESFPNFFAAYGFVSYVFLIFIARIFRRFVKRDETYYEDSK